MISAVIGYRSHKGCWDHHCQMIGVMRVVVCKTLCVFSPHINVEVKMREKAGWEPEKERRRRRRRREEKGRHRFWPYSWSNPWTWFFVSSIIWTLNQHHDQPLAGFVFPLWWIFCLLPEKEPFARSWPGVQIGSSPSWLFSLHPPGEGDRWSGKQRPSETVHAQSS